ncbi:MAG TPA: HIT family hydrolase [Syntrophus sp. (in: bacteria)]|nr:HIT family hydrolase [Syntrophus sp. (in: bacteria)]
MKVMSAPWRMDYIKSKKKAGCVFCKDDVRGEELVLWEGETAFVMMNRYPYISGHLMIIPYRHLSRVEDLSPDERREMFDLMDVAIRVLTDVMHPEGFNAGINLGKAAGAGIDDHLHIHVVPRWVGDTNFMSVVGEVRVIPEDLHKTWEHLCPHFEKYCREGLR